MSIVSSQIVENYTYTPSCPTHGPQPTRRAVREQHTDHLGQVYSRAYETTDVDASVTDALAAYAVVLAEQLEAQEIEANIAEVIE